jgi:mono/diheme cytochrome c family protein
VKSENSGDLVERNLPAAARFALISAAAIVLLVVCVPVGAQAPVKNATAEAGTGNVENGKKLYTSSGCYECHGREGQGSKFSGPRLGPPPISLGGFTDYIRQPKGQMPPYTSKVLSDAELADMYAFLKSIPKPPSAKTIPLLN